MAKPKTLSRTAQAFLFSGRPNPVWRLSTAQMQEWKKQWNEAAFSDKEAQRPSILGYTGCLLQNDEHSYWIIFNGCVSFYEGKNISSRKDEGRRMERWLIDTGPEEVKSCF